MDAEISPEEVEQLLDADEDVRVVDIRSEEEFERGHIPGSENIPFHAFADEIERLDGADRVVTVCPHGKASVQAARLVSSYEGVADGARVESMAGGLAAWEADLVEGADGEGSSDGSAGDATADDADAPF
ncbi:rhodanese-like domain-containing protein [Halorussus sp. AFM4]|uniref:rhodanese-like domain-containing protein n=1 Tax=Halorussus sp. AFM4 TaxID=3421651 RepID=UPI003EBFEBB0